VRPVCYIIYSVPSSAKERYILPVHPIAVILGILVGLLVGLTAWGFWRIHKDQSNDATIRGENDLLIGFLILAGFGLGVLLTYLFGIT
jgi:hypothetical protein